MTEMTQAEKESRILQAISTCKFAPEMTQAEKELAVAENALLIDRMVSENSLASRVLDAVRIIGTVQDVTFEESSKRYNITFVAEHNSDGKNESVRTERVDGYHGPVVQKLMDQDLVGKRCLIFKEIQTQNNDPARKVRVMPYIKVL